MSLSNSSSKSRHGRLRNGEVPGRPIRGAGIRIEHENGQPANIYPVEHSMVLHVEQQRVDEDRRRRMSLVEWFGHEPAPAHASRHVADLFAIDPDTLDFAIAAMREKIERDRHTTIDISRPTRFEIIHTLVEPAGFNTTLILTCRDLDEGYRFNLRIPLESSDYETQKCGQAEFSQLCAVLGIRVIEDSDNLVGRKATAVQTDEGGLVFFPLRFEQVAA